MEREHTHEHDSRHKQLDRALTRHQGAPGALVEILHTAQKQFGYLSRASLSYIAQEMQLPFSHVYGVASFYPFFRLSPPADREITVCLGTSCYVNGAANLAEQIRTFCRETESSDAHANISVRSSHCLGACGKGPMVHMDTHALMHADLEGVKSMFSTDEDMHS